MDDPSHETPPTRRRPAGVPPPIPPPRRRPDPAPPLRHLGAYDLLCTLATGRSSRIYLGQRRGRAASDRLLAIKSLDGPARSDATARRAFQREARLHASLVHPRIPRVWDYRLVGPAPFYAMSYVDGVSLRGIVRMARAQSLTLPLWFGLGIACEVAEVMQFAHERCDDDGSRMPVVHGGVESSNLLLGAGGEVYVIDFGAARVLDSGPSPVTETTDVRALGAVAYELCTGVPAAMSGPMLPPTALRPDLPLAVEDALLAGFEARSMRSLGSTLSSALEAVGVRGDRARLLAQLRRANAPAR